MKMSGRESEKEVFFVSWMNTGQAADSGDEKAPC